MVLVKHQEEVIKDKDQDQVCTFCFYSFQLFIPFFFLFIFIFIYFICLFLGGSTRPGFEGGSNPLYKSVRKYGFVNPNKINYQLLNLNQLQLYLDTGKIVPPEGRPLTIRDLKDSVFKGLSRPVKLLGNVGLIF